MRRASDTLIDFATVNNPIRLWPRESRCANACLSPRGDIGCHDVGSNPLRYSSDKHNRAFVVKQTSQLFVLSRRLKQQHAIDQTRSKIRQITRLLFHAVVSMAQNQQIAFFAKSVFGAAGHLRIKRVRGAPSGINMPTVRVLWSACCAPGG